MFRVTLITADVAEQPVVLCDAPDPIPTFGISLNHARVNDIQELFQAAYAVGFDRGNRRNTLSFQTTRGRDASGTAFTSPAAAMQFALLLPSQLPAEAIAKIEMGDGPTAEFTVFMLNTLTERADLAKVNGVSLGFVFTLNGGEIVANLPITT